MKTISTTTGRIYIVTPTNDCEVRTANGIVITMCLQGQQTAFTAPASSVTISDDDAIVTEAFKGAAP